MNIALNDRLIVAENLLKAARWLAREVNTSRHDPALPRVTVGDALAALERAPGYCTGTSHNTPGQVYLQTVEHDGETCPIHELTRTEGLA